MKTILIGSQKGGSGKSTLCVNLASALVNNNFSVTVLDADEQPTSSDWGYIRTTEQETQPEIIFIQAYGDIREKIDNVTTDYLLIDAAGHDSPELRSALLVCDVFIAPFNASITALKTLPYMTEIVTKAREHNNMKALAVINIAPTNVLMNNNSLAQQLFSDYPEFTLCSSIIYNRSIYDTCMGIGLGVVETAGKSASERIAKQEVLALMLEVLNA